MKIIDLSCKKKRLSKQDFNHTSDSIVNSIIKNIVNDVTLMYYLHQGLWERISSNVICFSIDYTMDKERYFMVRDNKITSPNLKNRIQEKKGANTYFLLSNSNEGNEEKLDIHLKANSDTLGLETEHSLTHLLIRSSLSRLRIPVYLRKLDRPTPTTNIRIKIEAREPLDDGIKCFTTTIDTENQRKINGAFIAGNYRLCAKSILHDLKHGQGFPII